MPFGDRRLHGVCCAEKGTFRFAVRARGRAGHASVPATADNALLKLAPAIERLGSRKPPYDVTDEPRAFLRAIGDDPDDPEGAARAHPRDRAAARRAVRADARRHRRPDDHLRGREDQRDPRPRRAAGRLPRPARHGRRGDDGPHPASCSTASTDLEVEFIEQVVGNRSAIETPLMDAIRDWVGADGDGAEAVPVMLPGVHRLAPLARRLPRLRRLRLLPPAPPDALRDLAADPLRRRAHRRARPRRRRVASSTSCRGGFSLESGHRRQAPPGRDGPAQRPARARPDPLGGRRARQAGRDPGRLRPQAARAAASTASRACAASCASARRSP